MKRISVFAAAWLAGCAAAGGPPAWLDGKTEAYPEARYLTATGTADNPEDAKLYALGNLAKIFEVQINETSRDESAAWRRTGDEGAVSQGTSQLTVRYVDGYTTKLLEGARIVETWHDRRGDRHAALAVISRGQLSTRLGGEIREADRYAQAMITRAGQTNTPFAKARALFAAQTALIERAKFQRDLQIVDATGRGIPPRWTVEDLDARIDEQLIRMRVDTEVVQDPVGGFDKALQAGLAGAGMKYDPAGADYRLAGSLDVKDLGLKDGWYWYRGALEVNLVAKADGKTLASRRWPLKASGQSRDQARVRLQDQVAARLNNELRPALLSFGGSEKE